MQFSVNLLRHNLNKLKHTRIFSNINKVDECGILLLNQCFNNYENSFDKFLIIFQNKSQKWGLPKGHMMENEIRDKRYIECAKRELFEETGIYLNSHKHHKIGTYIIKNKLIYVIQILKDTLNTYPIDTIEIKCSKWVNLNELNIMNKNDCNITLKETMNNLIPFEFKPIHMYNT